MEHVAWRHADGSLPASVPPAHALGLREPLPAEVVAYLVEENQVLKEQMKGRWGRLIDDQHRRLAAKAKVLGRRTLNQVATIVTPDTLMRWHHRLIAAKSPL